MATRGRLRLGVETATLARRAIASPPRTEWRGWEGHVAIVLHAGMDAAFAARRQTLQDIYFYFH